MKQKLFEKFDIMSMTKNSLVLRDKLTGVTVYMHRNAFNKINDAVDFRVVERCLNYKSSKWVEVLVWQAL